jgi:hypothetical protein
MLSREAALKLSRALSATKGDGAAAEEPTSRSQTPVSEPAAKAAAAKEKTAKPPSKASAAKKPAGKKEKPKAKPKAKKD